MNTPALPPQECAGLSEQLMQEGRAVIEQVDLDSIIGLLSMRSTAPVLAELDEILQALDGSDPARSRKRVGVIGRLLGQDLVAQSHPDPVENRVRVHLVRADAHARDLLDHVQQLEAARKSLQHHHAALESAIARAERMFHERTQAGDCDNDPAHRRLGYLQAIADTWRNTCAQIENAARYGRLVLDRHVQVREVLVPLWRQQNGATALNRILRERAASHLESVRREARRGLTALQTSTLPHSNQRHPAPADKEPSP